MTNYISRLRLKPHPEGGYFARIYSSDTTIITQTKQCRAQLSAIYYYLAGEDFSAWHRLNADEIWHYYDGGSAVTIYAIVGERLTLKTLGNPNQHEGATFQVPIPAHTWFAAELKDKNSFALMGCNVAPGFEYQHFELASKDFLKTHASINPPLLKKFLRK